MARSNTYNLADYPKEITLRDESKVLLKPMTEHDAGGLLRFFLKMPAEDRFYLKEDVTAPTITQRWARELNYDRALPLLAWVDGHVVADATLHRTRTGARRHVGELRILVDPDYRGRGLGTALLNELATLANESALEYLVFEAVADREQEAIQAAEFLGFVTIAVLHNHAKDLDGHPRDLVLMEMPLGKRFERLTF